MRFAIGVLLLASTSTGAIASESIAYTYDAKGRLVKVQRSGTINNGVNSEYEHDRADNRTRVKVTNSGSAPTPTPTPTPAGCTFTASPDVLGQSDEFSVNPYVTRNNDCAVPVTLSYTVTRISGSGQYDVYDAPFGGAGPFMPGNSGDLYRAIRISAWSNTVDPGDNLILNIHWTITSSDATITDADTQVMFCDDSAGC